MSFSASGLMTGARGGRQPAMASWTVWEGVSRLSNRRLTTDFTYGCGCGCVRVGVAYDVMLSVHTHMVKEVHNHVLYLHAPSVMIL